MTIVTITGITLMALLGGFSHFGGLYVVPFPTGVPGHTHIFYFEWREWPEFLDMFERLQDSEDDFVTDVKFSARLDPTGRPVFALTVLCDGSASVRVSGKYYFEMFTEEESAAAIGLHVVRWCALRKNGMTGFDSFHLFDVTVCPLDIPGKGTVYYVGMFYNAFGEPDSFRAIG